MLAMDQQEKDKYAMRTGYAFPWHEVYGPNLEKTVAFYQNALGMGVEKMEMGEMGSYTMLTKDGQAVCGAIGTDDNPHMKDVPPHWAVYMSVDDVDASCEKVIANGGEVVVPAMDIPSVGRMSLIKDPQGAHIWLFKTQPM